MQRDQEALIGAVNGVGDVTPDPTTGREPTENERIKAMVALALKAEEVGLDVFAMGEHHNPPFVPSSPTTLLGYIAFPFAAVVVVALLLLIQRELFGKHVEPICPLVGDQDAKVLCPLHCAAPRSTIQPKRAKEAHCWAQHREGRSSCARPNVST